MGNKIHCPKNNKHAHSIDSKGKTTNKKNKKMGTSKEAVYLR